MKLKTSHSSAKARIVELIRSGDSLLEKVTREYYEAKSSGTFVQETHIPRWQQECQHWYRKCLQVLQELFPTPVEAIKLKNVKVSPFLQDKTNPEWGGLTNTLRAKLAALQEILQSVNQYRAETKDELFIEDIDSFARARDVNPREVKPRLPLNLPEDQVQTYFEEIIGENFHRKDWGGETSDLLSSHITVGGERLRAAFLLKGRGTRGKLTIDKCGKNGDQIVRLFEAPADLYIIQHVDEIDDRVIQDVKGKVQLRNSQGNNCQMCIIDGTDTARILVAYGKIEG